MLALQRSFLAGYEALFCVKEGAVCGCNVGDCLSRTEEEESVGCGIDSTTTHL
jgi:hypothetical protein